MKFMVGNKCTRNNKNFLLQYNEMRTKLLKYDFHKRVSQLYRKHGEIIKYDMNLTHELLKKTYGDIQKITKNDEIHKQLRSLLVFLGGVMLTNDNMLDFMKYVYDFKIFLDQFKHDDNNPLLKEKLYFFHKLAIKVIRRYNKLKIIDFKLRNRAIILNKFKI